MILLFDQSLCLLSSLFRKPQWISDWEHQGPWHDLLIMGRWQGTFCLCRGHRWTCIPEVGWLEGLELWRDHTWPWALLQWWCLFWTTSTSILMVELLVLQLAHLLTETLGRKITHTRISKEEYIQQWSSVGYEELAQGLIDGELRVAQGSEQCIFRAAGAAQGGVSLRDYVAKNKHVWMNGAISQGWMCSRSVIKALILLYVYKHPILYCQAWFSALSING